MDVYAYLQAWMLAADGRAFGVNRIGDAVRLLASDGDYIAWASVPLADLLAKPGALLELAYECVARLEAARTEPSAGEALVLH